jgi:hypothetical protein
MSIGSGSASEVVSIVIRLPRQFLFQYHERLHLASAKFFAIERPKPPPHEELFDQRLALGGNIRFWAFIEDDIPARPDQPCRHRRIGRKPPAAPLSFQAGLPANVALPTGLVRKLKVKGDNQFFRSAAVSPVCARTTAIASRNSSSGPASARDSGVASTPSTSNPEIARNPHTA